MSEKKKWQFTNDEKKLLGPFSKPELHEFYISNEINNNTMIFNRGWLEWEKLSDWRELESIWSSVGTANINCGKPATIKKHTGDGSISTKKR